MDLSKKICNFAKNFATIKNRNIKKTNATIMENAKQLVGIRLQNVLEQLSISVSQLAQKSSLSVEQLNKVLRGEVDMTASEMYAVTSALGVPPYWLLLKPDNFFDSWHVTLEELEDLVVNNPSLRGFINGYMAELKVRSFFNNDSRITKMIKYDDHDRTNKSDLVVTYKGVDISFEIKSLQTKTVKQVNSLFGDVELAATFQCDASDRRVVNLQNGKSVETTCLRFGDFDILAINLFAFHGKWEYAFALNRDLPSTDSKKYDEDVRPFLIKSSIKITYPLQSPFVSDPFILLDIIEKEKKRGQVH